MTDPETAIGLGAIAAYLSKDGLAKLLGPTADYLGNGLKNLTQQRCENIAQIFHSAETKLGGKIDEPGQIPPKVLKVIVDEGSYATDTIAVEYFGGVLASSRTESGRDDRGARVARLLDTLSTYQLRTHYIVYTSIRDTFKNKGRVFRFEQDRSSMQIFVPFSGYFPAMDFSDGEIRQPQLLNHVFHGLYSDNLIENIWQFGSKASLINIYPAAPADGFVCQPSALGAELFLWAFGHGDKPLEYIFAEDFSPAIAGIDPAIAGTLATRTL